MHVRTRMCEWRMRQTSQKKTEYEIETKSNSKVVTALAGTAVVQGGGGDDCCEPRSPPPCTTPQRSSPISGAIVHQRSFLKLANTPSIRLLARQHQRPRLSFINLTRLANIPTISPSSINLTLGWPTHQRHPSI